MNQFGMLDVFPAAITIADAQGTIQEMNQKAAETFTKSGGKKLLGSNLFECHKGTVGGKLKNFMDSGKTNVYTIEKNGRKKLIYQAPLFKEGELIGYAELSMEIPPAMPHFVRT